MNTNYKNAVSVLAKTANLVDNVGRAQGWPSKATILGTSLFTIGAGIAKIDLKAIKEEMKSLTPEEKAEVNNEFDKQLSLQNVKLEDLIENSVDFMIAAKSLFESGSKLLDEVKNLKQEEVVAAQPEITSGPQA